MSLPAEYSRILREGRPLSEINPGSDEIGLPFETAVRAIGALKGTPIAVLGGDVLLVDDAGTMRYATAHWASEVNKGESIEDFAKRSHDEALKYIRTTHPKIGKRALFVLVLSDDA